jgi:formate dehydrogenase iron-sulfur subunit
MCADRVENGMKPACATACPTGGISFGPRDALLKQARERQQVLAKQTGISPRIYGETDLGGLGVMYILPEKASAYGLPEKPKKPTSGIIFRWLLGIIPGAALLYGMRKYLQDDSGPAEAEAAEAESKEEAAAT